MTNKAHKITPLTVCRGFLMLLAVSALLIMAGETRLYSATPMQSVTENEIKAAYLYRFLLFLSNPRRTPENDTAFRIAVIGDEEFPRLFEAVSGKPVGQSPRTLDVVALKEWEHKDLLDNNDILYIPAADAAKTGRIIEMLNDAAVLTVSDADNFLETGGMIQFVQRGQNIGWAINRAAVRKAGIELSAQLYRNALWVTPGN